MPDKSYILAMIWAWIPVVASANTPSHQANTSHQNTSQQIVTQLKAHVAKQSANAQYQDVDIQVKAPDPRLRLEQCGTPLTITNRSRRKLGRLTYKVNCASATKPWTVNVSVYVKAYANVVITRRSLPKNSVLTAALVGTEMRDVTHQSKGFFTSTKDVLGSITRYGIGGNKMLHPGNLLPPKLVNKGDKVILQVVSEGLNIRTQGIAVESGALGDVIEVKNARTARIVEGRVSGPGKVHIGL